MTKIHSYVLYRVLHTILLNCQLTVSPISEKYATLSLMSVAPTLIAEGAELGEPRQALHPDNKDMVRIMLR